MPDKIKLTAFENASILRRFHIFFVINSLIPLAVLYYFYVQIRDQGILELTAGDFNTTLIWVALGVVVGFLGMRFSLKALIDISEASKKTLKQVLDPTKYKELTEEKNEIVVLTRTFNEITSRLEENVKRLESAKKTLHQVLQRVSRGMSSLENIDSFLELIIQTVAEAFSAKFAMILVKDEQTETLSPKAVYGFLSRERSYSPIKITEETFGQVVREKRPLILVRRKFPDEYSEMFNQEMLCAPMFLQDKLLGLMCFGHRATTGDFKSDEINLIANLALQTAVAMENARLNENAEKTYFETISALALAVEARDKYSRGHLDRVADYATRIARHLNLPEADIKILRDGARLHDIGKIGIPDDILKKAGGLSVEERDLMRKHTEIGENIIKPITSLRKLCDVVRHHHELLDGSGYPDGLKGEQISLLTRILTIADIFDALTTTRSYREAYSFQQAQDELLKMKDKIDQNIVKLFLETLEKQA